MQVNSMFFLVALLTIPFCTSQLYKCSDKSIFNSTSSSPLQLVATDGDVEKAYNEVASCATLKTENDEAGCCYIKVKIENTAYDETYTLKGCYEVSIEEYINDELDFDDLIDQLESHIQGNNTNKGIEVKKVNLDCSSKYIQFVGISLLLLLL